ncbi:uncharacterized protein [Antedon mediterranea]|uniref:uncharacterized protein n=1 Tax=Antedon mediterranea TaxID=105859 RepID=UPI003AF746F9
MTYFKVLTVVVVLLGIWQLSSDAFMIKPFKLNSLHASCHVNWTFGINCSDVQNKLVNQVNKWSGRTYCPDNKGEKCLYEIVKKNMTNLDTKHTTPSKGYVDDQFFAFYQNSSGICLTTGYSTSETVYAVLDKGTNYCDLHNLITGSGLDKVPKYTETTNDNICTQYSSADCDVY